MDFWALLSVLRKQKKPSGAIAALSVPSTTKRTINYYHD
jgi:hypothetical protein